MHKLLVCIVLAAATPAMATLFWADGFNYADGELTINDGTGDNVSGGIWAPHSGETFDDNLMVSGQQLQVNTSGSEDANRLAGVTMGAGEKWYFGAQVTVMDTRANPADPINNDYFMHLKDNGFGFRARIYLDDPAVADPSMFTFGLSATSGGQVSQWGTDLAFGTTHQIMGSYDFDTGDVEMWVDPTSEASTKITDSGGGGTAIDALAFRQDFLSGTANNSVVVDVAAIGTTFDEVRAAIPEPSSLALLGIGALAVVFRRRR